MTDILDVPTDAMRTTLPTTRTLGGHDLSTGAASPPPPTMEPAPAGGPPDLDGTAIVLAAPPLLPPDVEVGDAITHSTPEILAHPDEATAAANPEPSPPRPPRRRGLTPAEADAVLLVAADTLDDLERARIALENRLRSLTRDDEHGKGVSPLLPAVIAQESLLADLRAAEHEATLQVQRAMRAHPLGPWVEATKGVGLKQAARLLAVIGDPASRSNPAKLWAYCGYHVLRVGHAGIDTHGTRADADSSPVRHGTSDAHPQPAAGSPSHPDGQTSPGAHTTSAVGATPGGHPRPGTHFGDAVGVAPSRKRGQKANWNSTAKMRAFLVAESCMKNRLSPYRDVYDQAREHHAEAVHAVECLRCGPSGKPALVGSPLSDGHKHARALRKVAKTVLLDLWREARRVRELEEQVAA